jgi:hypothetical protein
MKYSTISLFRLSMLSLLGGCSAENEAQAAESDDGILAKIEQIVGGKSIQSEAFIVLKSDEVRYMADMEVMFFEDDVKLAFNTLIEEREKARKNMSAEALSNNPRLSSFMDELVKRRKALAEREKSIDGKVEEMRMNLISNLKKSLADLSKQLASGGQVLEEFRKITTPYDTEIQETQRKLVNLKENQTVAELEQKAFKMVNDYIVKNSLKTPKLSGASGIFLTAAKQNAYSDIYPPSGFFLEFEITSGRGTSLEKASWLSLPRIPKQCQDPALVNHLRQLLEQKKSVESQSSSLRGRISNLQSQRKNDLIPWENRHNVDQRRFEQNYGTLTREFEQSKGRLAALQGDGAEKDQLLKELVSQIRGEIEKQREEIDDAEAEVHQEAIRSMSEQFVEVHYRNFINMLGAKSKLSIRTGSKGNFNVPAGMDYLFASRERENGEYIYWFLPIETKFGNFRLSNSNAFMGSRRNKKTWMFENFFLN